MLRRSVLVISVLIGITAACPHDCGQNEEWQECVSACGDGCKLLFREVFCTQQCLPAGCVCMPGHHRHPETGLCVSDCQCPTPDEWDYDGETEQPCVHCDHPLETFYNSNACKEMCPGRRINIRCGSGPGFDRQGCYCKAGFCRDADNQCVEERQIPTGCTGRYEAFLMSNTCQNNCPIPGTAVRCISDLTAGCYCGFGYCRKNGQCVPGKPNAHPQPIPI